jgi:DNA-directed RNA polymerase subunit beta'
VRRDDHAQPRAPEAHGPHQPAAPVAHIWFFKAMPSRLGTLLGLKTASLEKVIYFQDYIVIDAGDTPLKAAAAALRDEFRQARQKYGMAFQAGMGAGGVRELLARLDLRRLSETLREDLKRTSRSRRSRTSSSGSRPSRCCVTRQQVGVDDPRRDPGDPAGSAAAGPARQRQLRDVDLNDLYRRLINRNNRLKKLLDLNAPEVIIRNEKRMLQQSVDALFDNSRCRRPCSARATARSSR